MPTGIALEADAWGQTRTPGVRPVLDGPDPESPDPKSRSRAISFASGTNTGSFMGNAPTGRPMRIDVFDVIRVEDGKMVEHWGVPDRLGALLQLGLMRPPGAVAA